MASGSDQSATIDHPFNTDLQAGELDGGYPLAYAGLWLFTLVLYLRPNDLLPIGAFPVAKIVGIAALGTFLLEGMSAGDLFGPKPREVWYLLWLIVLMFLSVPLAIDPAGSLKVIRDVFLKVGLVFILLVSVTRSSERLLRLMRLTVLCGAAIAVGTLRSYLAGQDLLVRYRAEGVIGGMFGNPNDLAFALSLLIPLALGLCFTSRTLRSRVLYLACAGLMAGTVLVTYSRGGFLTLAVVATYLFFAMRRQIARLAGLLLPILVASALIRPGLYEERVLSIFSSSLDRTIGMGSAGTRLALLLRGLAVFAFNPKVWLLGIGVANFHIVSIQEQVTHNAYLEVLVDIGLPAFILYLLFLSSSFRGLRRLARLESDDPELADLSTLAVAIRASLLAYMVGSFFGSVAYQWYLYYIAAYAVCLRQIAARIPGIAEDVKTRVSR